MSGLQERMEEFVAGRNSSSYAAPQPGEVDGKGGPEAAFSFCEGGQEGDAAPRFCSSRCLSRAQMGCASSMVMPAPNWMVRLR